jgi:uncharacterized membrane protein
MKQPGRGPAPARALHAVAGPEHGGHASLKQRKRRQSGQAYRSPQTVEELTEQNVEAIRQLERAAFKRRSTLEHIADLVSSAVGSTPSLVVHALWFGGWIVYNVWPGMPHFDPFPFTFLTLVVSLEAIFLSTFILISQANAAKVTDRRNQLDLQINLLTEQENTKMLGLLQRIAEKVGVPDVADPSLQALEQATRPERLAEQIARAEGETKPPAREAGSAAADLKKEQ